MPEEVIRMAGVKERMAALKSTQKQSSQRPSTKSSSGGGNSLRSSSRRRNESAPTLPLAETSDPFSDDPFASVNQHKSSRRTSAGGGADGNNNSYASFSFAPPTRSKSVEDDGFGKVERRNSAGAFTREGSRRNVGRSKSADADDGFGKVERRGSAGAFSRDGSRRNVSRRPSSGDDGFGKVERRGSAGAFSRDGSRRNVSRRPSTESSQSGFSMEGSRRNLVGKEGSVRSIQMQAVKTGSLRNMKAGSLRNVNQEQPPLVVGGTKSTAVTDTDSAFPSSDPFSAFPSTDAFGGSAFGNNDDFGFGKSAAQAPSSPTKAKNSQTFLGDDSFDSFGGDFEDVFGDFADMTNEEKEKGETEARNDLDTVLKKELGDNETTENYKGARVRYVKAVSNLKPEEYNVPSDVAKDKKQARKHLRRLRQKSMGKRKQLDEMKGAWNKYDDFAQEKKLTGRRSKKYNIAEEEDDNLQLQQDLDETELDVVIEWGEFAGKVLTKHKELAEGEGEEDSVDSDIDQWLEEAEKIKEDKKALRKRQHRRNNILSKAMERQNAAISEPAVPEESRAPPPEAEIVEDKVDPTFKKKRRSKPGMSRDSSTNSLEDSTNDLTEGTDGGSTNTLESEDALSTDSPAAASPLDDDSSGKQLDSPKKSRRRRKPKPVEDDEEKTSRPKLSRAEENLVEGEKKPSPQPKPAKKNTGVKGPFAAWMNPPRRVKEEEGRIRYKCPEKTECWRKTRHNFVVDNAPFYWHRMKGDFEVTVHLSGDLGHVYDKAGLMIRVDREYWMVTTLEFFNSRYNHSTCITHDYTDWSICPIKQQDAVKSQGIWLSARKVGNTYEAYHSIDGETWIQTRQGLFHEDADSVRVGIFSACPMGASYNVVFADYSCEPIES